MTETVMKRFSELSGTGRFLIGFVAMLVTVTTFSITLRGDVKANETKLDNHDVTISEIKLAAYKSRQDINQLKLGQNSIVKDIEYIKKAVDKILVNQKEGK